MHIIQISLIEMQQSTWNIEEKMFNTFKNICECKFYKTKIVVIIIKKNYDIIFKF